MSPLIDKTSAVGKAPIPDLHVPLIVLGAGVAGLAAAIAAAAAGIQTMLIDENPVTSGMMGLDVPLFFGQRMTGAVQNRARMVETLVETNPGLADAFDLGIDVQLGVQVWGALVNGPSIRGLPKPLLGLADEERSWIVSFDRLIVAAGARDVAMGFAGWEKPGVMGARAASMLLQRYRAFAGHRLVVMGSGPVGLQIALEAIEAGHEVAAIVDVAAMPLGPPILRDALMEKGVAFHLSHAIQAAQGIAEVTGVVLVRLDADDAPVAGSETTVACDTVVMALGVVPSIELLDVLGCRLEFQPDRGGHVPIVDGDGRTSIPEVYAVGDCAGIWDDGQADPSTAAAEGARAGTAAAQALGATAAALPWATRPPGPGRNVQDHWRRWLRAEIAVSGWDVNICNCEEVTRRELVDLRPPRYLSWGSSQMDLCSLSRLAQDGPVNQDQVKRLTRAGMGPCQGRRCREQVRLLLSEATGAPLDSIPLASHRPPVRPLPLRQLAQFDEPEATSRNWTVWFNIPTQWTPHWQSVPLSASVQPSADDVTTLGE